MLFFMTFRKDGVAYGGTSFGVVFVNVSQLV
jgi:hypothetical protein